MGFGRPHISVRGEKLDLVEHSTTPCFCNEIEAGTSYFWSSLSALLLDDCSKSPTCAGKLTATLVM